MLDRKTAPSQSSFQPFVIKQVENSVLDNGVPVHLLQSGNQTLLKLEFVFKAGSWFETKAGVSYLSSKMLVEGTSTKSAKQIADTIAGFGAFSEVHQGHEHVNLTFYLLEKHLQNLLPIVADILLQSNYPEDELENLKKITIQTAKVNREKNQFIASAEFRKNIFGAEHPYGRQYWEEDISVLSGEDISEFAKNHFYTSNMEVFVSGQFNKESTFKSLNFYFGQIEKQQSEQHIKEYPFAQRRKAEILIEKPDAMQSSIRLGGQSIGRKEAGYIPLLVANELLGGFFGSRLMKNIREDKGFTYGIHSSLHSMINGAYFVISTDVKKENTLQTLDEIQKELEILKTQEVDGEELEIVKSYMLGRFMNSINTPFALMDKFKTLHYTNLDYSYYSDYVLAVQKVSKIDIQEVVSKYLNISQFSQVVVGGGLN